MTDKNGLAGEAAQPDNSVSGQALRDLAYWLKWYEDAWRGEMELRKSLQAGLAVSTPTVASAWDSKNHVGHEACIDNPACEMFEHQPESAAAQCHPFVCSQCDYRYLMSKTPHFCPGCGVDHDEMPEPATQTGSDNPVNVCKFHGSDNQLELCTICFCEGKAAALSPAQAAPPQQGCQDCNTLLGFLLGLQENGRTLFEHQAAIVNEIEIRCRRRQSEPAAQAVAGEPRQNQQLAKIYNQLAENVMQMSDEDVIAEAGERNIDVPKEAERLRKIMLEVIAKADSNLAAAPEPVAEPVWWMCVECREMVFAAVEPGVEPNKCKTCFLHTTGSYMRAPDKIVAEINLSKWMAENDMKPDVSAGGFDVGFSINKTRDGLMRYATYALAALEKGRVRE